MQTEQATEGKFSRDTSSPAKLSNKFTSASFTHIQIKQNKTWAKTSVAAHYWGDRLYRVNPGKSLKKQTKKNLQQQLSLEEIRIQSWYNILSKNLQFKNYM